MEDIELVGTHSVQKTAEVGEWEEVPARVEQKSSVRERRCVLNVHVSQNLIRDIQPWGIDLSVDEYKWTYLEAAVELVVDHELRERLQPMS